LVGVIVGGKKVWEGKTPISRNFPLFGCKRKVEGKKNIMWDPPKCVSFQKWTENGTMGVFWLK
jgi:hypothetical protein